MEERKAAPPVPSSYTIRLRVRHDDIDQLGHVNNAVYLVYAQEAAYRHAESAGFSLERMRELGGAFVIHHLEIDYHRPAYAGDELLVTTRITFMKGMKATRETSVVKAGDAKPVATAKIDYIWVSNQGRPAHIPAEAIALFDVSHS